MAEARLTIPLTDLWYADMGNFEAKRDAVVRRLAESEWDHDDLAWMLSALAQSDWFDGFNQVFNWIWDIADADQVKLDIQRRRAYA